jgi:hypothetical protein
MRLLLLCNPGGLAWLRTAGSTDGLYLGWEGVRAFIAATPMQGHSQWTAGGTPRELFASAAHDVHIRWTDLSALRAVDPWPEFTVEWVGHGFSDSAKFAPAHHPYKLLRSAPDSQRVARFAEIVEALFDAAARYAPRKEQKAIYRGWLDIEDVPWTVTDVMPTMEAQSPQLGAFRTASREHSVVAVRERPTAGEALLSWLVSSPRRPWRETPRSIVVTHEHVFARFYDGGIRVVPRSALRLRLGGPVGDAVYIFGRRTQLILTSPPDCPVRAALNSQLSAEASEVTTGRDV